MATKNNAAARIHAIATELGCDPELVGAIRKELGIRRFDALKAAVQARLSSADASADTTVDIDEPVSPGTDEAKPTKERKASLTLSQRRALLRLLDETAIRPASGFKALPFEHLVSVGYAVATDDEPEGESIYTLTASGQARAESINPGYRVWSSGETVADDPTRPVAGTHRTKRIEEEAAEVAADEPVEA